MIEELDYLGESRYQRQFAVAFDGDPEFRVPHVLAAAPHVLITEWVDGRPMSDIIANGTPEERDRIGLLYERFLLSGPLVPDCCTRIRIPELPPTHDGRLCVFDFGAVWCFPTDCRRPWARCCASRKAVTRTASCRTARRGFRSAARRHRPRAVAELPRPVRGAGTPRVLPLQRSGCAVSSRASTMFADRTSRSA